MAYRLIAATETDEPWLEGLRRSVYQELFRRPGAAGTTTGTLGVEAVAPDLIRN
jgi:hypothetical protein